MAGLYRKSPNKNDQQMLTTELHRQIEQQTADFLKRGGEIQYIRNGVSGQVFTPTYRPAMPAKKSKMSAAAESSPTSGLSQDYLRTR